MNITEQNALLATLRIGLYQKREIILLLHGHKVNARIEVFTHNTDPQDIERVLQKMELHYARYKVSRRTNPNYVATFCISHDVATAPLAATLDKNGDAGIPLCTYCEQQSVLLLNSRKPFAQVFEKRGVVHVVGEKAGIFLTCP